MMMRQHAWLHTLILAIVMAIFPASSLWARDSITLKATDHLEWKQYVVYSNGQEIMRFDLQDYVTRGEGIIPNTYAHNPPPISPDNRYFPFVVDDVDGPTVLLVNTKEKRVERLLIPGERRSCVFDVADATEWLATSTLHVSSGSGTRHLLFDIDKLTTRVIDGEPTLVFDSEGENYASIAGQNPLFGIPRIFNWENYTPQACFLRYNGYWVYPKPMKAYVTEKDKDEYEGAIPTGENVEQGMKKYRSLQKEYAVLRDPNFGMDKRYMFSQLAFVGETNWVSFVEQVYALDDPNRIIETNLVAIDASRVQSNPPSSDDILVVKQKISPIDMKGGAELFTLQTAVGWDKTKGEITLMTVDGRNRKESKAIGSAPVEREAGNTLTLKSFRDTTHGQ